MIPVLVLLALLITPLPTPIPLAYAATAAPPARAVDALVSVPRGESGSEAREYALPPSTGAVGAWVTVPRGGSGSGTREYARPARPEATGGRVTVLRGQPAPGTDQLEYAVAAALPERPEAVGTRVTVLREDVGRPGSGDGADWGFGTAVQLAPAEPHAYPYGWLWLARRDAGRWNVALEGSADFATLSQTAPMLRADEREAFAGGFEVAAATDFRTGMRLPYTRGQSWTYTGGPHPMSGNARSSIDLAGGDGKVRAARAGLAYRMCPGWIRVVHDRGFATDYYHLHGAIAADGKRVSDGTLLGRIGTDVSCGGSATGPHVHFSLRRSGNYVDIDRYAFGKWTVRAGARPYEGTAWHGSRRVAVGGTLYNYGALGLTEAVVDTNGGGVLNRRAGPGTGHRIIGTIRDGQTVRIECSARGTTHTGRGGYTSNMWNKLAGGGWVSDVFLWTGTGNPVAGWCDG